MEVLWRADDVRELDGRTIEDAGLPGVALMEAAGAAAARVLRERWPAARRVAVVCGPGNNGGDGFVVARHLREHGVSAYLCLAGPAQRWKGDAATMLQVARHVGVPEGPLAEADVVVDALFGTGFHGAAEGEPAALIAAMEAHAAPVLALDVPSGVNGTTGEVAGPAVRADVTVCFHGRKLGTAIEPGRARSGTVLSVPIGLIGSLAGPPTALRYDAADLERLPPRRADGSKYDAGAVLVIGGGPGMTGAPTLAARSALRAGAGVVRVAVPAFAVPTVAAAAAELMVLGNLDDHDALVQLASEWADAVVVGPGLERDDAARRLVDRLVREVETPLLADAGALFALSGRLASLRQRPGPAALTPHAGELARLLGAPRDEVTGHRLAALERAVEEAGCAILLKGPDTLVGVSGEPLRVVETAVPALATAGAGDVLAGVAGALLARGLGPGEALALAAATHGAAARVAAAAGGTLLASDLERPIGRLLGAI